MNKPKCDDCNNDGRYIQMLGGGIERLTCGKRGCATTASQINLAEQKLRDNSIMRSQEILRERGRNLSFDDLIAQIYKQGFKDAEHIYKELNS